MSFSSSPLLLHTNNPIDPRELNNDLLLNLMQILCHTAHQLGIISHWEKIYFTETRPDNTTCIIDIPLKHPIVYQITNRNHYNPNNPSKNPYGFRFHLIGNRFNQGGQGTLYDILGEFIPLPDGAWIYKNTLGIRILKTFPQNNNEHTPRDIIIARAANEARLEKTSLHCKPLMVANEATPTRPHHMVLGKLSGPDLLDIADRDLTGKNTLSIIQRFHFSRRAIRAVRDFHNQGHVHRDIKPDNLMLNDAGDVIVIDCGYAKSAETNDVGQYTGSFNYVAPEIVCKQGSSVKSDIFSLAITLQLIWRANFQEFEYKQSHFFDLETQLLTYAMRHKSTVCFQDLPDHILPEPLKKEISSLFERLLKPLSYERSTLEDASAVFDKTLFLYSTNANLKPAFDVGISFAEYDLCLDKRMTVKQAIDSNHFQTYKESILKKISRLKNYDSLAFEAFLMGADLRIFDALTTPESKNVNAAITYIRKLFDDFEALVEDLRNKNIQPALERLNEHPCTLAGILNLTKKLKKERLKLGECYLGSLSLFLKITMSAEGHQPLIAPNVLSN